MSLIFPSGASTATSRSTAPREARSPSPSRLPFRPLPPLRGFFLRAALALAERAEPSSAPASSISIVSPISTTVLLDFELPARPPRGTPTLRRGRNGWRRGLFLLFKSGSVVDGRHGDYRRGSVSLKRSL